MLADWEIRNRCAGNRPMISPFAEGVKRPGCISYGLSSYGYDIRLANEFKIFDPLSTTIVDIKALGDTYTRDFTGDVCIMPPHSFVLGMSYERIAVPRDLLVICIGKSSLARLGLIVNVTPLEPEWEGFVTIEISNTTPLPAKLYAGEGICQLIFLRAEHADIADRNGVLTRKLCEVSYQDKGGKYQYQAEITTSKVD